MKKLIGICLIGIWVLGFVSVAGAVEKVGIDPTEIGIPARPLGLGRAYAALGDDANGMFLNPAALGWMKNWQVTSMSQRLLGEVNYLSLGGVYPTNYGNIGIGYLNSSLGDIPITTSETRSLPIGVLSYSSNVVALSYGVELKKFFPKIEIVKDSTAGANLKFFSQSFSGTTEPASASGYDLDLGVQYQAYPWLKLGISQLNTLPMSLGAKLTWSGGYATESIPSLTKIGAAVKILGKDGGLYKIDNHRLDLDIEGNFSIVRKTRPATLNLGLEWWPVDYLAVRAGVDQDPSAGSVTNNLAAGVGLTYAGFAFDYAYHTYGALTENTTHTFSLSYGMAPPLPPKPVIKEILKITAPEDKLITYLESILIKGEIAPEVKGVEINGRVVPISGNTFEVLFPLKVGKNTLSARALSAAGKELQAVKLRILRLTTFADVRKGYWAKDVIDYVGTLGLVTGFPDGTFKPEGLLTRAELVTLLVRAKELPSADKKTLFKDVPATHWAAGYIKAGADAGLVTGYPDRTFRPSNNITRAEGVTVLARFNGLAEPIKITEAPFADVPIKHWAAKWISAAQEAGLLRYLVGKPFEPSRKLTRAEAVEILSRTEFASTKIKRLLSFETGY